MNRKAWYRKSYKLQLPRTTTQMSETEPTYTGDYCLQIHRLRKMSYWHNDPKSPRQYPSSQDHFWTSFSPTFRHYRPYITNHRQHSLDKAEAPHCKKKPSRKPRRTLARTRLPHQQYQLPLQAHQHLYKTQPRTCWISTSMVQRRHRCRKHLLWAHRVSKAWPAHRKESQARQLHRRCQDELPEAGREGGATCEQGLHRRIRKTRAVGRGHWMRQSG